MPLLVRVQYLRLLLESPPPDSDFAAGYDLREVVEPTPEFLRYLYYEVGERQFWWERRLWESGEWQALSESDDIRVFVLHCGDAVAGFFELNFAGLPDAADLAFFGLMPSHIGKGLGRPLLMAAVRRLALSSADAITLNTCSLDHVAALPLYQSVGFEKISEEFCHIEDPRILGLFPKDSPLPDNYSRSG